MPLDEREMEILEVLMNYPNGITFTELYKKLKNKMATGTFNKKLKKLVNDGFVEKIPRNPTPGRRVLYRCTDAVRKLKIYRKIVKEVAENYEENFKNLVNKLIINFKNNKISLEELDNKILDELLNLPAKIGGIVYILSWDFEGESRNQFIMETFEIYKQVNMRCLDYLDRMIEEHKLRKALIEYYRNKYK